MLDRLTIDEKIGQLICMGGVTGGVKLEESKRLIRDGMVGAVYVGWPIYKNPEEAFSLHEELQSVSKIPLFIAADLETGLSYIMEKGASHFPYPMGIGATDSYELAEQAGRITGEEAMAVGINYNFGPDMDVNTNPDNKGVGIRSFGDNPDKVAAMGRAYIRGCQSTGIICTAKHFPGAGMVTLDAHENIEILKHSINELEGHLIPFKAAIKECVKSIMSVHMSFSAFDKDGRPATCSANILTNLLRQKLGFDGLVISDALGMGAIEKYYGDESKAGLEAFKAGCDLILTSNPCGVHQKIKEALLSGGLTTQRIDTSLMRIFQTKANFKKPDKSNLKVFDNSDNKKIVEQIGQESVTILYKDKDILMSSEEHFLLVTQRITDNPDRFFLKEKEAIKCVKKVLSHKVQSLQSVDISRSCTYDEQLRVLKKAKEFKVILFVSVVKNFAYDKYNGKLTSETLSMLNSLWKQGKRIILLILGSPYASPMSPEFKGTICTYSDSCASVCSAINVLFGKR